MPAALTASEPSRTPCSRSIERGGSRFFAAFAGSSARDTALLVTTQAAPTITKDARRKKRFIAELLSKKMMNTHRLG
jgi:hypothetical protein